MLWLDFTFGNLFEGAVGLMFRASLKAPSKNPELGLEIYPLMFCQQDIAWSIHACTYAQRPWGRHTFKIKKQDKTPVLKAVWYFLKISDSVMSSPAVTHLVLIFPQRLLVSHSYCRIHHLTQLWGALSVWPETSRGTRGVKAAIWHHFPCCCFVDPFKKVRSHFTVISLGYSYTAKHNVASAISLLHCHRKQLYVCVCVSEKPLC